MTNRASWLKSIERTLGVSMDDIRRVEREPDRLLEIRARLTLEKDAKTKKGISGQTINSTINRLSVEVIDTYISLIDELLILNAGF